VITGNCCDRGARRSQRNCRSQLAPDHLSAVDGAAAPLLAQRGDDLQAAAAFVLVGTAGQYRKRSAVAVSYLDAHRVAGTRDSKPDPGRFTVVADVRRAGAWVFAGGLHPPSTATVVRVKDGDALTTDGPFAEGKEHIGGFWVVKAADLDAALAWAVKAAQACADPVEVRPFQEELED
jgi:hypothetical protein